MPPSRGEPQSQPAGWIGQRWRFGASDAARQRLRLRCPDRELRQHRSTSRRGTTMAGTIGSLEVGRMQPHHQDQTTRAETARSPMEAHSSFRGSNWSPQRLVFHQNLETFADRVGLLVGLQANGKLSQEAAFAEIRRLWKDLKQSKDSLIDGDNTKAEES